VSDHRERQRLVARALTLEYLSISWGVASATWSMTAGLLGGSLGVLGLGLDVAADIAGSIGLVWRFRVEQRDPGSADKGLFTIEGVVGV
jgi:hypothetical protein